MRLEVDRLDLELNPLPLLGGRLDVEEVRLVRPVLQIEPAAADRPGAATAGRRRGVAAPWARRTEPRHRGGRPGDAVRAHARPGSGRSTMSISICPPSGPGGAVVLDGTFALNGQPLRVDGRLGRLTDEASSTLRLTLVADDEDQRGSSTLTFGGVVWWRSEAPRLRGELVFTGADARSAIGRLGEALGRRIVPMPSWLAAPFRLAGPVELADDRLQVPDFVVELDGSELTGRLSLVFATRPEIDLALQAARLALPAELAALDPRRRARRARRPRVRACAAGSSCRSARSTTGARRSAGCGRRCSCPGTAPPKSRTSGRSCRARPTSASPASSRACADNPELRGKLTAVTENLRAALAWLDLSPDDVVEGRLSSLSLASQVSIGRDAWRFSDVELRVDASRATGSLVVAPAPRPQVAARLALDRLDVDAYWPDQAPADVLARLAPPLSAFDAAIEVQLARLTWRGVQLLDLGFAGRAVDGRLTIQKLSGRRSGQGQAPGRGRGRAGGRRFRAVGRAARRSRGRGCCVASGSRRRRCWRASSRSRWPAARRARWRQRRSSSRSRTDRAR